MNTLLPAPVPIVWSNFELRFPDVGVLEMYIVTDAAAAAAAAAASAAAAAAAAASAAAASAAAW
jgi:hypothetical protein